MLGRDRGRLADAAAADQCPLGAAALAARPSRSIAQRPRSRSASSARWPTRSTPSRPRLRARVSRGAADPRRDLSRLAEEIVIWLLLGSASSACPMPLPPAPRSCRRSATPTPPTGARRVGRDRRARPLLIVAEGLPLAYGKRHAGGQGAGLRRGDAMELSLAATAGMVATSVNAERDAQSDRWRIPDGDRSRRLAGAAVEYPPFVGPTM